MYVDRGHDMWRELLKQAIVTCEASYWNKSLWHVKRVIETNHCDKWSELLKQTIATGELQKQVIETNHYDIWNETLKANIPLEGVLPVQIIFLWNGKIKS